MSKVSKLLFSCVLLGSTIGTVQAETQYVTENLNTYLRRGAGDQFKIAGAIQSGEAVTVLGQEGKYTLIRDNKNREAWILTSELSSTPSSREDVSSLSCGLSTNEYVRKIRMKHAEQYLLEGKYNISEIAFKVGINNLFYFRQCFKEEFGCIPSEYLKRLKETGEK